MAEIFNRQRRVAIEMHDLEEFANRVTRAVRLAPDSFAVCLVSDAEMARMNWKFRGKQGATDVLSFPADSSRNGRRGAAAGKAVFLGDIAIAPQTARRNARRFRRTLADELRILLLHGVLHLMGYDHETDSGQMERHEMRLRRQLGIA